jgi:hypothetical protein
MINRGDLRLHAKKPGLTLRTQALDKRPAPPADDVGEGLTAFSGGLYHDRSGSRLLYGSLNERGLPARVTKPWNRGSPFAENRRPSLWDLRTEPSSTAEPEICLYLGLPVLELSRKIAIRGFGAVVLDGDVRPSYGGGAEAQFGKRNSLGVEGFYTGDTLEPRQGSAWFSDPPALPERGFRLWAANLFFNSPRFGISADGAYSRTFAYGEDLYGNIAFRVGDRPWRFSLAADAAGSRYVGRDGAAAGPGFRTALRLERRGRRNSLFRFNAAFRAPGIGEEPDRYSGLALYRFPRAPEKNFASLSRISLTLNRNIAEKETIPESLEGLVGFNLWKLQCTVRGSPAGTVSGETSYSAGIFRLRAALGYTAKAGKAPLWDGACTLSLRGKAGRLSLKIASADFPGDWTYSLSWRLRI